MVFARENLIKMDHLGVPLFQETSKLVTPVLNKKTCERRELRNFAKCRGSLVLKATKTLKESGFIFQELSAAKGYRPTISKVENQAANDHVHVMR